MPRAAAAGSYGGLARLHAEATQGPRDLGRGGRAACAAAALRLVRGAPVQPAHAGGPAEGAEAEEEEVTVPGQEDQAEARVGSLPPPVHPPTPALGWGGWGWGEWGWCGS